MTLKLHKSGQRPLIISGPCSAETREQTLSTCEALASLGCVDMLRAGIWKPRTSPDSFEGVGLDGLAWLAEARRLTGLPIAIEVATPAHVEAALGFGVDVLWLGARTTVNPFSVQGIADALRGVDVPVMVKNPMHPDLELWAGALERLSRVGIKELAMIHRGFTGCVPAAPYRNNPLWHLAIEMKQRFSEIPMFCDPSHICGSRQGLLDVAQRSVDLNFDGLVLESHISPCTALSDAKQQLTPKELGELLGSVVWRREAGSEPQFELELRELRHRIDQLDRELLGVLSQRMAVVEQIGNIKRENDVTILQLKRWDDITRRTIENSGQLNLGSEFLLDILNAIHIESIAHQTKVMNRKPTK